MPGCRRCRRKRGCCSQDVLGVASGEWSGLTQFKRLVFAPVGFGLQK